MVAGSPGRESPVVGLDACAANQVDERRLAAARQLLVSSEESAGIANTFAHLADPGRARVPFALLGAGETCECDLAEMVEMSPSALSHGPRLLRTAGVVTNRRDGRMVSYRLADGHVHLLLDITREHMRHADVHTPGV